MSPNQAIRAHHAVPNRAGFGSPAWYKHAGVTVMKTNERIWIALMSLGLAVACGPTAEVASTEGDSEDDTGTAGDTSATNPNPTNPNPTQPDPDTSAGTSAATGDTTDEPPVDTGEATTDEPPPSDSCCEPHEAPGCNEEDVVDCVCAKEAFCCAFEWDENCVDIAVNVCEATCEDPPGTTDTGDTGSMGGDCEGIEQWEILPSEATYSGAWELGMSMVGEGEISVLNQMAGVEGSVLYEIDIPCNDTWYIWTRYWEQGADDSYFVTLDGEPMPAAIFEGDCTGGGQGYGWAALNWRDEGDPPCTYVEDPWAPQWDTGIHEFEFSFRESLAMGRILITNDETFVP